MDNWNYKRREAKRPFKVYLHYYTETGSDIKEPIGEVFAFSAEQAAKMASYNNGDGGARELKYNGYIMTYEAEEL